MSVRKISGHYLFPVTSSPLRYGILVMDEDGSVVEVVDRGGVPREEAGLVFYNGVIVPGFIVCVQAEGDYPGGEALTHIAGRIREAGVRGALVVFRDRAFRLDLSPSSSGAGTTPGGMLTSGITEISPDRAEILRQSLVTLPQKEGERIGPADLFPARGSREEEGPVAFGERLYALTGGGAQVLDMHGTGAFEKGFRPGVVVLEIDFDRWRVKGGRMIEE